MVWRCDGSVVVWAWGSGAVEREGIGEEEEEEEEEAALNPPHVRTIFQSLPRSSRPVGAVNVKHTCGRA